MIRYEMAEQSHRERLPVARERLEAKPRRAKAQANYLEFTEARVAGLRIKPKAYLAWDRDDPDTKRPKAEPGLAVMVMPSGRKTYTAHYNLPGNPTRGIAIGRVGGMTLEEARKRTRTIRDKADDGIDPRAGNDLQARIAGLKAQLAKLEDEKVVADLEVASRVTFAQLLDDWHRDALAENKSAKEVRSLVHYHTQPWAARPALAITKEVRALLLGIKDGTGDTVKRPQAPTANRLHSHLHALFAWAEEQEVAGITKSPMRGVDLPSKAAKQGRKRAWFAGDELVRVLTGGPRILWRAALALCHFQPMEVLQ